MMNNVQLRCFVLIMYALKVILLSMGFKSDGEVLSHIDGKFESILDDVTLKDY